MKHYLSSIALVFTVLFLAACTGEYDTFGVSPYKNFNSVQFEEQDGDAQVYTSEHRVVVNVIAPRDSQTTWDSLTIENVDMSSMASLHLVKSRFREEVNFPKDSATLDSLANALSYDSKALESGDKIRIPKSLTVYMMVVAESGDPSIWQFTFKIPGVVPSGSETSEGNNSGNTESSSSVVSNSSSSSVTESSSSVALSSKKNFEKISFENQKTFRQNESGDSIIVGLENGTELANVKLKEFELSEGAFAEPKPSEVGSWKSSQSFKVTAEDGSSRTIVVVLNILDANYVVSSEKALISIKADGEESDATIDSVNKSVVLHLPSLLAATKVSLKAAVSDLASTNIGDDMVNVVDGFKFTITAEDASTVEWTVTADYPPPVAPRIVAMKIAGNDAIVDSVAEAGKTTYWVHYDELEFNSDLSGLKLSDVQLTNGAELMGVSEETAYDLGRGIKASVYNGQETVDYEIRAGYQLPGNDFNSWKSNGVMSPDSVWGNANTVGTTTSKYSAGSVIGAQIKTTSILGKIASGSLYTADFNPNGVGTLAMASSSTWPDGNELLDFGKKFAARPSYIDVTFSYNGAGDSCDVYLVLENRTGDKNRTRSSSDVNKLVASAWYRSTTGDNTGRTNPDVVSVSEQNEDGFRTMRMKLKYGEPLAGSPIENSSVFNAALASKDSKAIDNSVIQGTGDEPVTHIRLVFASSADGNHYNGSSGATLVIDGIKFIY